MDYLFIGLIILILLWNFKSDIGPSTPSNLSHNGGYIIKHECNDIDNRCYSISDKNSRNENKISSEKLAYINVFIINIIRFMRHRYVWGTVENIRSSKYRKAMTLRMMNNYNPDNLIENVPNVGENTSFVDNKGELLAFCLKNPFNNDKNFVPTDVLTFVILHELAHISAVDFGHDSEFWLNFKILIEEAIDAGLYIPTNYGYYPVNYCNLILNYNPIYDDNIDTQNIDI